MQQDGVKSSSNPGILLAVAGPAGVGKGTVVKALLERYPQAKLSISATTRKPRPTETEGVSYFFVDNKQFDEMIAQNALLEWALVHQKYRYGTPKHWVNTQLAQGKLVILEIDLDGVRQIKESFPKCRTVFLAPPSWEELEARLRGRGTENEAEIRRRLETAKTELAAQAEFDLVIVNDEVKATVETLANYLELR